MKKFSMLVVLLAVSAIPSIAQLPTIPNLVDYFSNNEGPGGAYDQQIRLINTGVAGTPLTSPVGDVCANIYVFDANQEMVACCSCRITPNGLRTISVANNLTNNPVTSVVPADGDISILSTLATGTSCSPVTYNGGGVDSLTKFSTHVQRAQPNNPKKDEPQAVVESNNLNLSKSNVNVADPGGDFLPQACQFTRYLGSGKGTCSCGFGS